MYFLVSTESPHFLIANLKFHLETPGSFGDMTDTVKFSGIPINNYQSFGIIVTVSTFFDILIWDMDTVILEWNHTSDLNRSRVKVILGSLTFCMLSQKQMRLMVPEPAFLFCFGKEIQNYSISSICKLKWRYKAIMMIVFTLSMLVVISAKSHIVTHASTSLWHVCVHMNALWN